MTVVDVPSVQSAIKHRIPISAQQLANFIENRPSEDAKTAESA